MLSELFLRISLLGAEWILYVLMFISLISVSLIINRILFYQFSSRGLVDFRRDVRQAIEKKDWDKAKKITQTRAKNSTTDFETSLASTLLEESSRDSEVLSELAQDSLLRTKVSWDKNLSMLATIGSNAPFVGLFGTVIGIIQAFHSLSQQAETGVQGVTAGISDALIATAVGIFVAIPAVVAFNYFQRKVKNAVSEAEAFKSFIIGNMIQKR